MDTLTICIIIACYLGALAFGYWLFTRNKPVVAKSKRATPTNDYDTLLGILNETIKREITHKYELDYKVKDIKFIYNFEADLKELTSRVMNGLSEEFRDDLEYYHPSRYIVTIVMRNVQIFLMEYTRANKIKTK